MRVLLITSNVGSVFDAIDHSLGPWLDSLDDMVTNLAADFIALHLQEIAGAAFEQGSATIEPVQRLANAVTARFPDYWSSGIMCSCSFDADCTALGIIVLVRRSLSRDVAIFSFEAGQAGGWLPVSTLADPLMSVIGLPARWSRHSSFSRDLFDALDPAWTRKGWLHTRWRISGQPLDLLNVHLFDDLNHLRALRRGASALSVYAASRQDALRQALQMLTAAGPAPAALGPLPPALLVFGDLNWRLDLWSLLSQLAGENALQRALSAADSDPNGSSAAPVVVPIQTPPAPEDGDDGLGQISGWRWWARRCRCLGLGRPQRAVIEPRRFSMDDVAVFGRTPSAFRACDLELAAGRTLPQALEELEVAFPPTHSGCSSGALVGSPAGALAGSPAGSLAGAPAGSLAGAPSLASPAGSAYSYNDTCCPSWRDRVLMDATGMRLMRAANDVRYAATQTHSQGQDEGQTAAHRQMIHLVFTLAPSAALGASPIPVHVRANVSAPVPIKVKYVAVGAG